MLYQNSNNILVILLAFAFSSCGAQESTFQNFILLNLDKEIMNYDESNLFSRMKAIAIKETRETIRHDNAIRKIENSISLDSILEANVFWFYQDSEMISYSFILVESVSGASQCYRYDSNSSEYKLLGEARKNYISLVGEKLLSISDEIDSNLYFQCRWSRDQTMGIKYANSFSLSKHFQILAAQVRSHFPAQ